MSALGYDPVPGDVDAVARVAALLGVVAGQAETITTRLARLDNGVGQQVWRGPAADVFRSLLAGVGPDITKLVAAHREAEDALHTYAGALGAAQGSARRAENDAAAGLADRERAECDRRRAAEEAASHGARINECRVRIGQARVARLTAIADPVYQAEMDRYENQVRGIQQHAETGAAQARGREDTARAACSTAEARVQAARLLARQATEIRDHAARRAVDRLDEAGQVGEREGNPIKGIFGAIDDKLRRITAHPDFGAWMQRISDVGGVLLNIGSLVALFPFPATQALGALLMTAGIGLKAVSFVGTAIAVRYGNASKSDLAYRGLDLGLSLVTRGTAARAVGQAKRMKFYGNAGSVKAGDWGKIVPAQRLTGGDRGLAGTQHKSYFRTMTGVELGSRVINASGQTIESAVRLQKPVPQRPDIISLAAPAVGAGGGAIAARTARPVLNGAAAGATDLGLEGLGWASR